MMEKFRTIRSTVAVAAILAVFCGAYKAQWAFAILAAIAGVVAELILRGIAMQEYQPEESEGEISWWQKMLTTLKDNRSVVYMIVMGTMILSYMNPFSVCANLAIRLVPILVIELVIQRVDENKELEKQQEYKPTKKTKAKKAKTKHYL